MAGVQVFFSNVEKGVDDVMRVLQVGYSGHAQGYYFDSVEYTGDHRLVRLTRGGKVFHVPTANILMIVGDVEGGDR